MTRHAHDVIMLYMVRFEKEQKISLKEMGGYMLKLGSFFRWIPCGRKEHVRDTGTVTSEEEFGPDGLKYKWWKSATPNTPSFFVTPRYRVT